jgi:hypothetical protein
MKVFCTYFDHNYLPRGLALHGSLREHCPDFQLWVLCLTPECHEVLLRLALPEVRLITLDQLELFEPRLTEAKGNRTTIEYFFTCTPLLPLFVFRSEPVAASVTYVDGDMLVFHPLDEVWDEIADSSIAIVAHRFPPALQGLERWGIYNVGWLTFRRDPHSRTCLEWWRDRCLEWCHDRLEDGKFADQKYLDDWPERFSGVKVISHPGVNLAPWNLGRHQLAFEDNRITVDGRPLLIFHYHGLKQRARSLFDPQLSRYSVKVDAFLTERIYGPYLRILTDLAGEAGLRQEDAGLNLRGVAGGDTTPEVSLRQKWIECDRLRHEPGFGGFMAPIPASVGVVMATANDAARLPAHLASMTPWLDLVDEIVVVDGNSTDGTIELLREHTRHPRLRILSHSGGNLESWNLGVAQLGSDFTYLSKIGEAITRDGMKQLLGIASHFACDIVASPPPPTPESSAISTDGSGLVETIFEELRASAPTQVPRCRMMAYAARFALNHGALSVLSSMAGNLFRTEMLQALPFPDTFGSLAEIMWCLQNLPAVSVAILPERITSLLHHSIETSRREFANIEFAALQIQTIMSDGIEQAVSQKTATDREALLRLKELAESMTRVIKLRRMHSDQAGRLDILQASLPFPALWFLSPRVWHARWKCGRARKELLEAEASEAKLRSLIV